jgi:hypothetical protein
MVLSAQLEKTMFVLSCCNLDMPSLTSVRVDYVLYPTPTDGSSETLVQAAFRSGFWAAREDKQGKKCGAVVSATLWERERDTHFS